MKTSLLTVSLFVGLCAFSATTTINGVTWRYTVSNNSITLGETAEGEPEDCVYCGSGTSRVNYPAIPTSTTGAITIPTKINGMNVVNINNVAFENCTGLTSISIPSKVKRIGSSAFSGCSGLTSVTIPDSVTSIGDGAFRGCSGLTSVTIPDSVTSIGFAAFSDCSGLTSVTIGNGVTSIGSSAFYNCSGLTSVTIGNGVTSIDWHAFDGCSGLTSVTIPDSVTSIGSSAFSGCSDSLFDTATIPGVKLVDGWAVGTTGSLSGNLDLTGVRGIGSSAFSGCSGLTSVTIPDSVTSIGEEAFDGCTGLTSATIHCSVIGPWAFYGCTSLSSVTLGSQVRSIRRCAFARCPSLTDMTIPSTVSHIEEGAFMYVGDDDEDPKTPFGLKLEAVKTIVANKVLSGDLSLETPNPRYNLTQAPEDRAIASVTVSADTTLSNFVLSNGKVYDTVLRIVNTSDNEVRVTLPSGYQYETIKGANPLTIPANSRNILTITRTADNVFLVSRRELETVQ